MSGSASTTSLLRAEGIRKSYGGRTVLDVSRLELSAGTITAVLGPSGAGKSTLLRIVGLLEAPDAGVLSIDGASGSRQVTPASAAVTVVFQEPTLLSGTVEWNVGFGLAARGVGRRARARRVAEALERVGLGDAGGAPANRLSGGEAQRVALARAMVTDPRVLLLDEPLGSLDEPLRRRLASDFASILREMGCAVAWVTHDQAEAAEVSDQVVILSEGKVVAHGSTDDVLEAPKDSWTAGFVGRTPPITGQVVLAADGVLTVKCDEATLVGIGSADVGDQVAVLVPPDDVVLYRADAEVPASSARNMVAGRVEEIRRSGAARVVTVRRGAMRLTATVLPVSVRDLELEPGLDVLAAFKATATRVTVLDGGR